MPRLSKKARDSQKKMLDLKQSIGARIFTGTEQLKLNLILRGFDQFLISIKSFEDPEHIYAQDELHPIVIVFMTPDKFVLGAMILENKYEYLMPEDSNEFMEDSKWVTLWDLYAPLDGPIKTKIRGDQDV